MREFKAMMKMHLSKLAKVSKVLLPLMLVFILSRTQVERLEELSSYGIYVLLVAMVVFYSDIDIVGEGKVFLLLDVLPLRRRTVMLSYYLMTLILLVVFEVMVSVVLMAGSALGVAVDAGWPALAAGNTGIMLSIFSIIIPVWVGSGTSRGRLVLPLLMAFVLAGLAGFRAGMLSTPQGSWEQPFAGWFLGAMPWLLLLVGLVAWVASLFVSIRNYERQDP